MIDTFLKAKHWQLFLLIFGIPLIFQIMMMTSMVSSFTTHENPDTNEMLNYMKLFPLIMILFIIGLFGWLWSVAIGLQKKVPENVIMKVRKFKVFFIIPMVYIIFLIIFMSVAMTGLFESKDNSDSGSMEYLFAIIVPLHLFSMFCIFYSLYFVAKTFKTVELQRNVKFGDFAGEFFMIWFYPIGIWILQPKINKMIEV